MSDYIHFFTPQDLAPFRNKRANEQHVADRVQLCDATLSLEQNLSQAKQQGVRYVIVGVPEDIGPRANCGNGGAHLGWQNFLDVCLNQQANQFFDWSSCLLLGALDVADLQRHSYLEPGKSVAVEQLRELCQELDARLTSLLNPIFAHDFELIVIGGGHNNAYPIIKALNEATAKPVACTNLDPHADFRAMEGRHSGNPFRYAYHEQALSHYCVLGLHEQKNNQATVQGLMAAKFPFYSFQSLFMRQETSLTQALNDASTYVSGVENIGVELDVDAVKNAGASAYSISGFSVEQAMQYVHTLSKNPNVKYLHLCEGAPMDEGNDTGQLLTQLVYSYLTARN